jgi:hypothetical protein
MPYRQLSQNQINKIFQYRNPLTNDIIERKQLGDIVYELSYGDGLTGIGSWRVTVIKIEEKIPLYAEWARGHDLSQLFYSRCAANGHINKLRVRALLEQ